MSKTIVVGSINLVLNLGSGPRQLIQVWELPTGQEFGLHPQNGARMRLTMDEGTRLRFGKGLRLRARNPEGEMIDIAPEISFEGSEGPIEVDLFGYVPILSRAPLIQAVC